MTEQTQPNALSAAQAQAWETISEDARTAIFERSEGSEWARRWWNAEATLIELRRQKEEDET